MHSISGSIVLGLFVAVCLVKAQCPPEVGATVQTETGPIIGHAATNRTAVSEYLGIPYAKPPIGSLRFAEPQKFTSDAPFEASAFSPDCPANISPPSTFPNFTGNGARIWATFTGHLNNSQSEDCLTLNVWTKATSSKRKPVLVWFHGGRFTIPGSHNPFYNGEYFADEADVVVVTLNYRVNIFGFSGAPGAVQNVGLLDQRLAVEWVRDNIEGFGGDPRRITIFGQSAGGVSVDYYSYAWTQDPIVNGLVSHSGTAFSLTPNSPDLSATYFYNVSGTLGCGTAGSDAQAVLQCMRSQDFRAILRAVALVPPAPSKAIPAPVFHPTVDNKTVFGDYSSLSSSGNFIKVPYLLGIVDNEAGFYKVGAYAARRNLSDAQWDLFNLAGFTCPTSREAANRVNNNVTAWRYVYSGDFPDLRLYPGSGAYHGSELTLVFGTAQDVSGTPNTPAQHATSRYMMRAWAAFARDPYNGLKQLGWPVYNPQGETLVQLARCNEARVDYVPPDIYDSRCPAINDPSPAQGAF